MSEQPFADDELYEIRKDALHVRNNPVLYDDKHVKDAEIMLRLVAALRAAWRDLSGQFAASEVYRKRLEECRAETEQLEAERGRVVAVTRHRDVTLTTYERANASDEATGGGG